MGVGVEEEDLTEDKGDGTKTSNSLCGVEMFKQ